jgi:hypothetical protein
MSHRKSKNSEGRQPRVSARPTAGDGGDGEDEKAANLFDVAAALEAAIRTTQSSDTIEEQNI